MEKLYQWAGRERCPLPFLFFLQWIPFWCLLVYFSGFPGISLCSAPSVLAFCFCFPMFCYSQKPFSNPLPLTCPSCLFTGSLHITSISLSPLLAFSLSLTLSYPLVLFSWTCLHYPAIRGSCFGGPHCQGPTIIHIHILIYMYTQIDIMYITMYILIMFFIYV